MAQWQAVPQLEVFRQRCQRRPRLPASTAAVHTDFVSLGEAAPWAPPHVPLVSLWLLPCQAIECSVPRFSVFARKLVPYSGALWRCSAATTMPPMQGRARFVWRRMPGRTHPCPAARRGPVRCVRNRTSPHGQATALEAAAVSNLASLKWLASPKPDTLLDGFCPEPPQDEQVAVNSNGQMLFLRLAEITWVKAANWGVELHVGHQTHRLRDTFGALAAKLPPDRFLRLNARVLVNVTELKALGPRTRG